MNYTDTIHLKQIDDHERTTFIYMIPTFFDRQRSFAEHCRWEMGWRRYNIRDFH